MATGDSSTAPAPASRPPFSGFAPAQWIVSLNDEDVDEAAPLDDESDLSHVPPSQHARHHGLGATGRNRQTVSNHDRDDDDFTPYGPTLRRRGNISFVPAAGLADGTGSLVGATRSSVAGNNPVQRGASVRGLYESIVGALTPPVTPSLDVSSATPARAQSAPALESVDVDLTIADDDDDDEGDSNSDHEEDDAGVAEVIIVDADTGQERAYRPRRSIVPAPTVPAMDRPVKRLPPRAIHEMLPENLTPLKLPPNYHLRPSNVGWQMLSRQGWNEGSALGPEEDEADKRDAEPEGLRSNSTKRLKVPLRGVEKHDRKGLGVVDKTGSRSGGPSMTRAEQDAERCRLALIERDKRGKGARGMERQKVRERQEYKAMMSYMNRD